MQTFELREFISNGIKFFREKWKLNWKDITLVTAGDVLASLSERKVLNTDIRLDYAVFEPETADDADYLAEMFGKLGIEIASDKRFGSKVWLYVFSHKTTEQKEQWPALPSVSGWKPPMTNRKRLNSSALPGEMTPFMFHGREYRVENVMAHNLSPGAAVGSHPHEDHFRIRRTEDDRLISIPLMNHYFATAFVWNDACYCFSLDLGEEKGWSSSKINMISSKNLVSWEVPVCVLDVSADGDKIFNNSITHDSRRFVMVYETNDPRYPIFTFKFAESDDLVHWCKIPGAIYGKEKYAGGPTLHWISEEQYYYLTYVDMFVHPVVRKLNYRTSVTRSKDLVHWEDAPSTHAVLLPDYGNRPDPNGHPDVHELNASDAEYIEKDGIVRAYFCGGNQWGVTDNQTAEYHGTLAEFFRTFYS